LASRFRVRHIGVRLLSKREWTCHEAVHGVPPFGKEILGMSSCLSL
jgi:hypothetical protein